MFSMINRLAKSTYGMTAEDAHSRCVCIRCQEPVMVQAADGAAKYNPELFYSEPGKKEWDISGMCEKCFDTLFDEEEQ